MTKINLTPKEVLQFIILGIKNENYQASINLAKDCIKEMERREKEDEDKKT